MSTKIQNNTFELPKNFEGEARLSKVLAQKGFCSRREADEWISSGKIFVNDQLAELGIKVKASDQIKISEEFIKSIENNVCIIINKPPGILSAHSNDGYKIAEELLFKESYKGHFSLFETNKNKLKGLAPAGRLDINSSGLLLLTNDGRIARKIISPQTHVEKEYIVGFSEKINKAQIQKLTVGLKLDGVTLKRTKIEVIDSKTIKMILLEGRKRQIRRMCDLVDIKVKWLKRVRIGNIKLGKIKKGEWVILESDRVLKALSNSTKLDFLIV